MLASINGTSLDGWIQQTTYKMQSADIYDAWEDANRVKHRHIYRQRISGSFDLVFTKSADHNTFNNLVANNRDNEGKLAIKVYVQNTNTMKDINAFYNITASSYRDLKNGYIVDRLTVTLEEA